MTATANHIAALMARGAAMDFADLLATDVFENLCAREHICLGGRSYTVLQDEDYAPLGYAPANEDAFLVRRDDGLVFEVWLQAGAQAIRNLPPLPGARKEAVA